jgi:hypothetical protein
MKFSFYEIERITTARDNGAAYMTLEGSMSERSKLDALAELWEYLGDDAFLEFVRSQGFKVIRDGSC